MSVLNGTSQCRFSHYVFDASINRLLVDFIPPLVLSGSRGVRHSPYHYIPTRSIAIVFIALFGFSTGKLTLDDPRTIAKKVTRYSPPYWPGNILSNVVAIPDCLFSGCA
jgi:hypothetical protein